MSLSPFCFPLLRGIFRGENPSSREKDFFFIPNTSSPLPLFPLHPSLYFLAQFRLCSKVLASLSISSCERGTAPRSCTSGSLLVLLIVVILPFRFLTTSSSLFPLLLPSYLPSLRIPLFPSLENLSLREKDSPSLSERGSEILLLIQREERKRERRRRGRVTHCEKG